MVQMFVPSVSRPTRQQVEKEVQKIYPDAKLMSFLPRDLEPGEPTVMMGEEKRDEYGDIVGGLKNERYQRNRRRKILQRMKRMNNILQQHLRSMSLKMT